MSFLTQLHVAARDGNQEKVEEILEGKNGQVKVSIDAIDASGQTALHLAAKWGRLPVVKVLIDSGANLEIKDRKGRTAMDLANDSGVQSQLSRRSTEIMKKVESFQKEKRKRALLLQKKQFLTLTHRERLDDEGVWDMMRLEKELEGVEIVERVEEERWEELNNYMKERPLELKEAAFQAGVQSLRRVPCCAAVKKKTKEEAKRALEESRQEEIRRNEERRAAEQLKEEKRAHKELNRERTCGRCGQVYTNATNRPGFCMHTGKWANWGTDRNVRAA
ncbi:hypothetical protein GUITHDRAFT_137692 [Guillardia theta CCMP2712]|uniref:Uncharacterized protein n=1 Tax=Guillardia theta (strain CCMP2712) TaxID=905079 RepID=L1JEV9_GUITC|nr:hypothetical protein GUITHDRAFT_137692 [Guillardia theta CCMP2712]EKX47078.1 hypothetical protein GUITHDRAFT_137692 [Guillardia theta CCMP2712]|eukprot:XP_005834058.1 hypothetical protein GUITHDRAFT_137692 [Guillardia theta CCMP2712]